MPRATPSRTKRANRARLHRSLVKDDWAALKAWWGGCAYCQDTAARLTRDCVLPLRGHGIYAIWNVVPACLACNSSKAGLNVFSWMRRKGLDAATFERRYSEWWQQWTQA